MSSTRNTLAPFKAISAGDLSQSTVTSAATNVRFHRVVTIQLIGTGTPTGTWAIQVSNVPSQANPPTAPTAASSWTTLSIVPPLAFSGGAATLATSFDKYAWEWIRAVYTRGSGSGSVDMYISAQGQ
jgi:hypothetical protein